MGLRPVHGSEILARAPRGELGVDWLEAVSENYLVPGGRPLRVLGAVRAHAPVVLHGVAMNLGSTDPLDRDYLDRLAALVRRVEPAWVSDHLCWTGVGGRSLHDLMPLPFTEEVVRHVAARIRHVQEHLGRRIAVENVSTYLRFEADALSEAEFLAAVADEADCGILLDVNNLFVNACNHGFDAAAALDALDARRVFQIHLAGHSRSGALRIDTHDAPVCNEVWSLFERVIRRLGPVSTLIEWDDRIPPYERLVAEAGRARAVIEGACAESAA